jgi:hypothetical protein
MSKLLRAITLKTGLAVLGGACLVVVIAWASAATSAKASAAGTTRAPAAVTAAPYVDHQLCYVAGGAFRKVPPPGGVQLNDQFNPNGFLPQIAKTSVRLCNPVKKTIVTPFGLMVAPVTNAKAHLVCYPMTEQNTQPTPKVLVSNQFGQAVLGPAQQPNEVCVPSWKSLTGLPNKKPDTPPALNHFTCYPVTVLSGSYQPPAGISLLDEFTRQNVPVQINPVPTELCLPAEKIILTTAGNKDYPIINPDLHLLCFPTIKTPQPNYVWAENQFGSTRIKLQHDTVENLCLPSKKQVLGPQG